jgi:two-component system sensor histidine kinase/response regulator
MKHLVYFLFISIRLTHFFFQEDNVACAQNSSKISDIEKKEILEDYNHSNNKKAALKRIIRKSNEIHFDSITSLAYEDLADIYIQEEKYDDALEQLTQALHYTNKKNISRIALLDNKLGIVCQNIKKYDKAINYYQQAANCFLKCNDDVSAANAYVNMGNIYYQTNRTELSKASIIKASEVFERSNNLKLSVLGQELADIGDFKKALTTLSQSLETYRAKNDDEGVAATLASMGHIYIGLRNYGEAEKTYNEALMIAKKYNYKFSLMEIYKGFSHIYTYYHDNKRALKMYDAYMILKASISAEDKLNHLLKSTYQLNIKIKDQELALAKREHALTSAQNKNVIQWLIIILLLSIILGFIAYRFYQKYKQQEKVNTLLSTENDHLESSNQALSIQQDVLQQSNMTRDKIFSILAHDLRSPLNSLKGFIEILANNPNAFSKEEISDLSKQFNQSLYSLNTLLENLLKWAMNHSGLLEFQIQELDCDQLINENIQLYKEHAAKKNINIHYQPCSCKINADTNMMNFIIRNLIQNAIKFSNENTRIDISTTTNSAKTTIVVKDEGVGLNKYQLDHLFDIEKRILRVGTKNEKGTGLGLVLSQEFLQKHNGSISATSEEGKGTTFFISIPN